jgi:hypothetical protein
MPRNGSGTYTVPTTLVASTRALAADVNGNFTDVASAMTGSLAIDGQSTMTGQFKAADGSISAPGIGFGSDGNTGFYRSASGVIRASLDGTNTFTLSATTATVTGALSVSGTATLGGLTIGSVTNAHVPSGAIIMWSGSIASIPTGWFLCNGSNGTPDLRNRFIIGAHSDNVGVANTTVTGSSTQTGGTKDAINVSHTHTATVTDPGHTHTTAVVGINAGSAYGDQARSTPVGSITSSNATTGITVGNSTEGSSGTNQNLPPYFALAFIMKA